MLAVADTAYQRHSPVLFIWTGRRRHVRRGMSVTRYEPDIRQTGTWEGTQSQLCPQPSAATARTELLNDVMTHGYALQQLYI